MVQAQQPDFTLADIPDDDPETFEIALPDGKTSGVFQIESTGMTGVCVGLKPQNIEDITAVIALYRPGPMESIPPVYCLQARSREGHLQAPHAGAHLSQHLRLHRLSGAGHRDLPEAGRVSIGQADNMRRAISKRSKGDIQREREAFLHGDPARSIAGCTANGIPEAVAESIYDEIYDFANYAFNKAHAVSYAMWPIRPPGLSATTPGSTWPPSSPRCWTAPGEIAEYIAECRSLGIPALPPDINQSGPDKFTVAGQDIRFGLAALKGWAGASSNAVLAQRQAEGPFRSFPDFCQRLQGEDPEQAGGGKPHPRRGL